MACSRTWPVAVAALVACALLAAAGCGAAKSNAARQPAANAHEVTTSHRVTTAQMQSALLTPKDLPYGDSVLSQPPYHEPKFCDHSLPMRQASYAATNIRLLPPPPNLYQFGEQLWGYQDAPAAQHQFVALRSLAAACASAHVTASSPNTFTADVVLNGSKTPGQHAEVQLSYALRGQVIVETALARFDTTAHLDLASEVTRLALARIDEQHL